MGNSKGNYRSTTKNRMAAFDKLPPSARKALADAVVCWAPQPLLTRWRRGLPGYRTGAEIADMIAKWDRVEIADREIKRRKS
jgi:Family of unknown function (DUF6525)